MRLFSTIPRLLTIVLAASALVATTTMPAQALSTSSLSEISSLGSTTAEASPEQERQIRSIESQLKPLLDATSSNGMHSFDPDLALKNGASKTQVKEYATAFKYAGGLVLNADNWVTAKSSAPIQTLAACTGKSGYNGWYITGWQWALNSCQTSQLISLAGLGAGAAGTIAAILAASAPPAAPVAGIAAGIVTLGAGFLSVCQAFSSKNAIYLNSGTLSLPTCWGQ